MSRNKVKNLRIAFALVAYGWVAFVVVCALRGEWLPAVLGAVIWAMIAFVVGFLEAMEKDEWFWR